MAKQLSMIPEERNPAIEEWANRYHADCEAAKAANERKRQSGAMLVRVMQEAGCMKSEITGETGTGMIVVLNLPEPTVHLKVFDHDE
jgi:hypothetical protein